MKDKRFIALIVGAIVGIIGVVTLLNLGGSTQKATEEEAQSILGGYADGHPIVYNHKGVGEPDESLPTVDEYFDYSCSHCAQMSVIMGGSLAANAKEGKYNLAFHPVVTSGMIWNNYATTASIMVAENDPEHWLPFHEGLLSYLHEQAEKGQGAVFHDAGRSVEQIQRIATEVGVSADLVKRMNIDASEKYHQLSAKGWDGTSTPELRINGGEPLQFKSWEEPHSIEIVLNTVAATGRAGASLPQSDSPQS